MEDDNDRDGMIKEMPQDLVRSKWWGKETGEIKSDGEDDYAEDRWLETDGDSGKEWPKYIFEWTKYIW